MFIDDRYSGIILDWKNGRNVFFCEKKDVVVENGFVSLLKPISLDCFFEHWGDPFVEYGVKLHPLYMSGDISIFESNKPAWAKRTKAEAQLRSKRLIFQKSCNNFFSKLLRKRNKKRRIRKKMLAVLKALKD
jgi:hypothetical protein